MKRLISFDPSLNCTGWSVVDVADDKTMSIVDYGYIPNDKDDSTEQRLGVIYRAAKSVIEKHHPDVFVGESQFFGANVKTLMQLSHTHGVLLLLASTYGKRILYYSPMTIKSTVLGGAKAKTEDGKKKTTAQWKREIELKMLEIFGASSFSREYTNDVTDSLAVAACYVMKDGTGFLDSADSKKSKSDKKKKATSKEVAKKKK